MNKKPSVKHHFLPRHYLRGFVNEDGKFYVYDKSTGKIFESSPDNAFFEKHLNTVTFPSGEKSDFLEDAYTHIENESWRSFNRIKDSDKDTKIELLDKMSLYFFLLFLHWRLPANINNVEILAKKAFDEKEVLNYFSINNKDGSRAPDKIIGKITKSSAFKKSLKLLIPFAPFFKDNNWQDDVLRWRFLYPADGKNWYVVGDVPLITTNTYDDDPINCLKEFVFPISGKILLVNTDPPIEQGFPPELVVEFNMAIFERSQRFIASPNKKWLEAMVGYYNFYKTNNKTQTIIPKFFSGLKSGIL